jgi:hypothetical protein
VAEGQVRGSLPAEKLYELFDFTRANNLGIASVSRRKMTLEDSFMKVLGHEAPRA